MKTPIDALAEYLTGPCVAVHSIGLSLSGMPRVAADRFYEVRQALGVHGYATADEARTAIRAAVTQ